MRIDIGCRTRIANSSDRGGSDQVDRNISGDIRSQWIVDQAIHRGYGIDPIRGDQTGAACGQFFAGIKHIDICAEISESRRIGPERTGQGARVSEMHERIPNLEVGGIGGLIGVRRFQNCSSDRNAGDRGKQTSRAHRRTRVAHSRAGRSRGGDGDATGNCTGCPRREGPPVSAMVSVASVKVTAPPQVLVNVVDPAKGAGNTSVKLTPVRVFEPGFVTVKVEITAAPPGTIFGAEKDFVMVGGPFGPTVSVAVAVFPSPAGLDVTVTLLMCAPAVVPVTLTEIVQEPFTGKVAPESEMLLDPARAVKVPPPHVALWPFGVETVTPAGRLSVKPTPVRGTAFAAWLVIVKLRVELPFSTIVLGVNAFVMDGGGGIPTWIVAFAVSPLPPSIEVIVLVTLVCVPMAVPITLIVKLHVAPAARVTPVRLRLVAPPAAVIVPEVQLLVSPVGVVKARPGGSGSVKPIPVKEPGLAGGFPIANVSDVELLSRIEGAPKLLVNVGGANTFSVTGTEALPVPPLVEPGVTLFSLLPGVVPVTLTEKVQVLFGLTASVAPDSVIVDDPGVAATVPPHGLAGVNPLGLATVSPAARVSVRLTDALTAGGTRVRMRANVAWGDPLMWNLIDRFAPTHPERLRLSDGPPCQHR